MLRFTLDRVIMILACLNFLTNSVYSSIAPFFPLEAMQKGVPSEYIGFIFAFYSFTKALVSPVVGKLMNYFERKSIIVVGLILESIAIMLFGFLDNINDRKWFAIGASGCRMMEGVGNAFINTAIYALVTSHYKNNEADIISFLQIFTGVGMMTGPLFGSLLYALGGF